MSIETEVKNHIRDVADFPKEGILFKDITPILENPVLCRKITIELCKPFEDKVINAIVGVESRGFLFGFMMAQHLNVPFIPVRKKGKLPYKTLSFSYDLEYGSATVEMHIDSIKENWNIIIHDDLLATGGTAGAAAELIQMQNANVAGFSFLVGLSFLEGKRNLEKYNAPISCLVEY
jgi:adenine phosphoribosyltransferase